MNKNNAHKQGTFGFQQLTYAIRIIIQVLLILMKEKITADFGEEIYNPN